MRIRGQAALPALINGGVDDSPTHRYGVGLIPAGIASVSSLPALNFSARLAGVVPVRPVSMIVISRRPTDSGYGIQGKSQGA